MEKLSKKNKEKVLDVLVERLCFERAGVRLYDKVLERMRQSKEPAVADMLTQMKEFREQDKEHEEWLQNSIRSLGGDPTQMTEKATLTTQEAAGIEAVIMRDPELPHLFHALLAAELVDNAGWRLLVEIADAAHARQAKKEFKKRLREEEQHLAFLREALRNFSAHEILGEELESPRRGETYIPLSSP